MTKINRTARDTVFSLLFSQRRYQLELYNALHPDEEINEDDIECITLTNFLIRGLYNDLGLLIKNRLMVFVEAQTRWDKLLDVRLVAYWIQTLYAQLSSYDLTLHDARDDQIPNVEFYVVYTGNEPIDVNNPFPDRGVRLNVRIIKDIADHSIVSQYISFSHIFSKYQKMEGLTSLEKVQKIIEECIENDILTDFLKENESEVHRSMISLFDEEYIQKARDNIAKREGREEGLKEGQERINQLYRILMSEGNHELLDRCIQDDDVLESTLKDYGL